MYNPLEAVMTRYPKKGKGSKWTSLELKAIPSEWKNDAISDGEGLSGEVRVLSNGQVSVKFKYIFRLGNKTSFYQCGTYPANELQEIRENRNWARQHVSKGIDPRTKKKFDKLSAQSAVNEALLKAEQEAAKAALDAEKNLTIKNLFDTWVSEGVNRKDGNKSIIQSFNKYILPVLDKTAIKDLQDKHLISIYKSIIGAGKHRTAMLLSKDITQMLTWAEKRKPYRALMIDGNPALLVNMATLLPHDYSNERDRCLSMDEIKKLSNIFNKSEIDYLSAAVKYEAERPLKKEIQLAMWICLSTLCRIGELLMTEWQHVNFEKRLWHIPKENTKGMRGKKQDQDVYLSDFALQQFKELHNLTGDSKWAFPARYTNSHVCLKSASKQVGDRQVSFKQRTKKLKYRVESNSLVLGDREWTPHDLRRTGATMMQVLKIPRDIINLCQNHVVGSKVDRSYLHYDFKDEKREAWQMLGKRLQVITNKLKGELNGKL